MFEDISNADTRTDRGRWGCPVIAGSRVVLLLGWLAVSSAHVVAEVKVEWWVSSQDMKARLSPQPPLAFAQTTAKADYAIEVDPGQTYQSILGLGSSLEHSTCYNISRLSAAQQAEVLRRLIDPGEGIGMSMMRICIGTPDFTPSPWYSYDDMPAGGADPELKEFSIDKDRQYVLPILRLAASINPDIVFFASPWSPPGWMKTNGSLCGGRIDPQHFRSFARYMARFIEAYAAEGIRIHAVTLQNEPGYCPDSYPTCCWTAEQQLVCIRDHLGPELQSRGLATKIWCFDHNFNNVGFPIAVLSDPEAARYVDGTAFHHYEGRPSAMTALHEKFPDKHIYFSEGSVFGVEGIADIIAFLRNWARSYNAWVAIIDHKRQPNRGPHDCSPTCVVLNSEALTLEYRADYYLYGQVMKFIRPGAVRIDSGPMLKSLPNVAVQNPDGSIVLVVANPGRSACTLGVTWGDMHLGAEVEARSVATYRWPGR